MKTITIIIRNSKILSLLFFLFTVALVSGQAGAQKITLDVDCEIPLSGPVTIDLLSGDIIATSVSGIPGSCTDGSGGEGGTAPTLSFTVNGSTSTTVTMGTAVNAVWSSPGATSCTATGGWSGSGWATSKDTSGTQSLPTGSAVPNTYTLNLTCTNETGPASLNRSVTINAAATGECATRQPPPGMIRETNMDHERPTVTTRFWTDLWPTAFPNGGNLRRIRVRPNRYGALEFNTGSTSAAKIDFSPPTSTSGFSSSVSSGEAVVTLSACPGDFGPQPDPRCRDNIGKSGTFRVSSSSFRCSIEPNQTLFFNIIYANQLNNPFGNGPGPAVWSCDGSTTATCGHIITAQGN